MQERLGHSSAEMTLNVYAHLRPDSDQSTREAVDAVFTNSGVPDLCHRPKRIKRTAGHSRNDGEPACRRGSVQPEWAWVTIHLRGLPGERPLRGAGEQPISHAWPCSGWGLPSRTGHPARWCALTAPFHPCLCGHEPAIGGLFSVALSCGSPRLAVSQHSALWSPDLPRPGPAPARRHSPDRGHPAGSPSSTVWQTVTVDGTPVASWTEELLAGDEVECGRFP